MRKQANGMHQEIVESPLPSHERNTMMHWKRAIPITNVSTEAVGILCQS